MDHTSWGGAHRGQLRRRQRWAGGGYKDWALRFHVKNYRVLGCWGQQDQQFRKVLSAQAYNMLPWEWRRWQICIWLLDCAGGRGGALGATWEGNEIWDNVGGQRGKAT